MVKAGIAVGVVFAISGGLAGAPVAAAQLGFDDRSELVEALPRSLVFDLGVVDYDGDGDLDLFTTNHNYRGGLLANHGGGFVDRLTDAGLDQSPGFPGFEIPRKPSIRETGVYLYRTAGTDPAEGSLVVHTRDSPDVEFAGTIEFAFPIRILQAFRANVSAREVQGSLTGGSIVTFSGTGDARIILEPTQMAAPAQVEIDGQHTASQIFVGPFRETPRQRRFTLQLRDRHGIAWGDYNRDRVTDAFIVRGGLKGQVASFADDVVADELMLGDGGARLADAIEGSGLSKGDCRGREADPVDFNRDGRLDLFWGCQNAEPALYRQRRDGTFKDVSSGLRRVRAHGDHFAWIDVAGDRRQELVGARRHTLVVYRHRRGKRWKRLEVVRTFGESPGRIVYADYDSDGDPDLFCAAPDGNTLLLNRDGRLKARRPGRFGLPAAGSVAASWVDYDNDGLTDLYLAPQGLFRGGPARGFHATGLATIPGSTEDALATWFDYDSDGARDLAVAIGEDGWRFELLRNLHTSNHWLEVELTGRRGAYPAAGASVTVKAGGRRQTRWVGESDGARYSRGHYRLYFGLGAAQKVRELKVRWPGGETRKLRDVAVDRLASVSFARS